jgi:TPR repeat protein
MNRFRYVSVNTVWIVLIASWQICLCGATKAQAPDLAETLRQADAGDPLAQAIAATHYSLGWGVTKDPARAMELAQLSAKQGNPLGIFRVGALLRSGDAGPKNESAGLDLQRRSVEGLTAMGQNPYALTALGILAFQGKVIPKDWSAAAKLYKMAAEQRFAPAQYNYSMCAYEGQGIPKSPAAYTKYLQMALDQNYPPALDWKTSLEGSAVTADSILASVQTATPSAAAMPFQQQESAQRSAVLAEQRVDSAAVTATISDPDGFTNIRQSPTTNSVIVGTIQEGEVFEAMRSQEAWWLVRTKNNIAGYVHSSRIRLLGPGEYSASEAKQGTSGEHQSSSLSQQPNTQQASPLSSVPVPEESKNGVTAPNPEPSQQSKSPSEAKQPQAARAPVIDGPFSGLRTASEQEKRPSPPESDTRADSRPQARPMGPSVKGLQIGMDFQNAIEIISQRITGKNTGFPANEPYKLQGPFPSNEGPLKDWGEIAKVAGFDGPYVAVVPGFPVGGIIRADQLDNVVFISMTGPLTKALFEGAADLPFQQFAEEFARAYGLNLEVSEDGEAYETRHPEGVLVRLGQDFSLRLEKTKTSEDVKSAFD